MSFDVKTAFVAFRVVCLLSSEKQSVLAYSFSGNTAHVSVNVTWHLLELATKRVNYSSTTVNCFRITIHSKLGLLFLVIV